MVNEGSVERRCFCIFDCQCDKVEQLISGWIKLDTFKTAINECAGLTDPEEIFSRLACVLFYREILDDSPIQSTKDNLRKAMIALSYAAPFVHEDFDLITLLATCFQRFEPVSTSFRVHWVRSSPQEIDECFLPDAVSSANASTTSIANADDIGLSLDEQRTETDASPQEPQLQDHQPAENSELSRSMPIESVPKQAMRGSSRNEEMEDLKDQIQNSCEFEDAGAEPSGDSFSNETLIHSEINSGEPELLPPETQPHGHAEVDAGSGVAPKWQPLALPTLTRSDTNNDEPPKKQARLAPTAVQLESHPNSNDFHQESGERTKDTVSADCSMAKPTTPAVDKSNWHNETKPCELAEVDSGSDDVSRANSPALIQTERGGSEKRARISLHAESTSAVDHTLDTTNALSSNDVSLEDLDEMNLETSLEETNSSLNEREPRDLADDAADSTDVSVSNSPELIQRVTRSGMSCGEPPEKRARFASKSRFDQAPDPTSPAHSAHSATVDHASDGVSSGAAVIDKKNWFKCTIPSCKMKFKFEWMVPRHLDLHHRKHNCRTLYDCSECGMDFMGPAKLAKHSVHNKSNRFVCEACDFYYPTYCLLLRHKKLVHEQTNKSTDGDCEASSSGAQ